MLRAVPAKHAKQIAGRIRDLAGDPESGQTTELKGYAPLRRLKSGEYRVIYEISGDMLNILVIGKRNDDEVYQILKRQLR